MLMSSIGGLSSFRPSSRRRPPGRQRLRPRRRRPAVHLRADPRRPGARRRRHAARARAATRSPIPQLPRGLRTVDGSFNNLVPGPGVLRRRRSHLPAPDDAGVPPAEPLTIDPDGPGARPSDQATSYSQKKGIVSDSQPRVISNLIVDQTAANPAALARGDQPVRRGRLRLRRQRPIRIR